jgi:mannose-1-phosphate guanylyltransferase
MNAMLLTAGLGVRMLPLSLTLPKPAIPVLGRPMVAQILERLARAGIERAVLNLHHLPEAVRRAVESGPEASRPAVEFSHEEEILGTAGGIGRAAPALRGDGPILIHNGDFLSDIDISAAVESHLRSKMAATLVLTPSRAGYSTVDVDGEGRVLSLAGLPEVESGRVAGSYLFTGCHVMDERLLDSIPAGRASDIVRDLYRGLAAEGRLGSYLHRGFWWEFGSPELYLLGSLSLLDLAEERRREVAACDTVTSLGSAVAAIGGGALLGDGALIVGRAAVGAGSRIGEGARLEDSVVMPGASIGTGCLLKQAVISPGVELPDGTAVEGAIVCHRQGDPLVHPFDDGEAEG